MGDTDDGSGAGQRMIPMYEVRKRTKPFATEARKRTRPPY